jgi:signal transduction histidine kinase
LDAAEQARMRAEAADRVKTQFLSNISHELRTPLNAIIGYAELLVSEEILTKEERLIKQVEFNPKILANGVHLRGLVDDLLELARLEDQVVRITSDEVNPTHLITTVVSNQQGLTGGKPVTLEAICDPGLPKTAHWDQRRVTQILNNLIGNAVKFTDQGSVKVHAMPHPTIANHISIAVSDTGMGMPPDAVTYIFERFRQVDSSDERRHGGAGLGLSITKGLLDLLGGDVCVQSELGKGSTFTITLPTEIKPAIPTIKSDH